MWFNDSTLYQIYPLGMLGCPAEAPAVDDDAGLRAQRGCHRIRRLIDWIPHLSDLGIDAVLLNPVAASDSHGYDTRDLREIDARLGTKRDLIEVVDAFHAAGIRVILDAVLNHVGRSFWAFRDVRERGAESAYADWFNISFDGDTAFHDGFWYEGWEGNQDLVRLNLKNPAVVGHLVGCVRRWRCELGIDGLRLDVAYLLDRDFLRTLRRVADEPVADVPVRLGALDIDAGPAEGPAGPHSVDPAFPLIGEMLGGDYTEIVNPEMLDSCTNYECYKGLHSSFNSMNLFEIAHSLARQFGSEPWALYRGAHLLSFSENHDVTRLASILDRSAHLRPAYGLLIGMPGVPCLYYGGEWGQLGEKGGGLTADRAIRPPIAEPAPNELTAFIARAIAARRTSPALRDGAFRNVVITNRQLLFERTWRTCGEDEPARGRVEAAEGSERVLVAVNADDQPYAFADGALVGEFEELLSGTRLHLEGSYDIEPYGICYLRAR